MFDRMIYTLILVVYHRLTTFVAQLMFIWNQSSQIGSKVRGSKFSFCCESHVFVVKGSTLRDFSI
ncbi:UNKNOWN [Stylonychia lemnae]|uniref:Uncharacterized protein n=1 Tax=Stylonychia lemnae TaxID=5949 RepID=A0A078ALI1_STYLE|nr:UNKNOWN [Stylonychia lemnae]|eukprot:CDW82262.1 UNKNOWN [Stylonychia lemnae]